MFSLFHAEGIEAVLVKGWAIARRYPDRALRPYGDLDVCVRPDSHARAAAVLARIASLDGPFVDLHSGFTRIGQTKTVKSRESKVNSLSALRRLWTQDSGLRTQNKTVKSRESGVHSLSALRRLWTQDSGLRTQTNGDWDELYERSKVVQCPTDSGLKTQNSGLSLSVPVRVLCDEDHLRLLCLHLLRSGAHRPAWLCDVSLLLETAQSPRSKVQSPTDRVAVKEGSQGLSAERDTPGSHRKNDSDPEGVKENPGARTLDIGHWTLDSAFDWDVCLGRNRRDANWVGVVVRLAEELLGADISQTPFAERQLPRWLAPAVLEQWGGRRVWSSGQQAVGSVQTSIQSPTSNVQALPRVRRLWTPDWGLWTDLYRRWDNPIRSTAAVGGRFDERSRLPYRLLESAMRLTELPEQVRKLVSSEQ